MYEITQIPGKSLMSSPGNRGDANGFLLACELDRAAFARRVRLVYRMRRADGARVADGISLTFAKFMGREDGAIVRAVAVA